MLKDNGCTVRTADSCAAAKLLAAAHSFDVLLCDLGLPDGDGRALLAELKAVYGIKAIAVTGFGEPQDIRATHQAASSFTWSSPSRSKP